jgi:membrane protein implicated in regulation of membrane protease activity
VNNWVNWTLVILGVAAIAVEVLLGAVTGFDLALLGGALIAGGVLGLVFGSTKVGLFAAGAFAFIYLAFLRRRIRSKLTVPNSPSNTDALIGRNALVTERIAPHVPGMVRVGDEVWRARLADEAGAALEPGVQVKVESIEGVTLRVR